MAQQAFGLPLELRARPNAQQLLSQVFALFELLARGKEVDATPIMLSVRAMPLRRFRFLKRALSENNPAQARFRVL